MNLTHKTIRAALDKEGIEVYDLQGGNSTNDFDVAQLSDGTIIQMIPITEGCFVKSTDGVPNATANLADTGGKSVMKGKIAGKQTDIEVRSSLSVANVKLADNYDEDFGEAWSEAQAERKASRTAKAKIDRKERKRDRK